VFIASGSVGVNTPLRELNQVNVPAKCGRITSGEFVAGSPTRSPFTMIDSNLNSKVVAGVGTADPITSST
jgi:hypothetical protein